MYNIEPKVNEEISLNLLENMLSLYAKVHALSFVRDVKKWFQARIKKVKSGLLRKDIKRASYSKKLNQYGH